MTEILANASEVSPFLSVTRDNATWLSAGLTAGGGSASGLVELNNSTGKIIELPANISFLSIIGERSFPPGDGSECRFVFDPPLLAGWGLHGPSQDNYTHVDTGNPSDIPIYWQNGTRREHDGAQPQLHRGLAPGVYVSDIENVTLLDQQLDPTVQYKLAIVSGPRWPVDARGLYVVSPPGVVPEVRVSANPCEFSKLQVWQT